MKKTFYKCPLCAKDGKVCEDSKLVMFHSFVDGKFGPITHKWSVNTGRMFNMKAAEEDELW